MATPHKLSSNEVAALVDGLKSLEMGEPGLGTLHGAQVKPYKFGADNTAAWGEFHGLRVVNERFCRIARSVFHPFLRIYPRISGFPPEIKSYSRYCEEIDNFSSLTISRIDPLRGTQMMVLEPSFVSLLTEAYFGGAIRHTPNRATEFTATENRMIELLIGGLNEALEQAWRDLSPLNFTVQSQEENLQFASFVDAEEMIVNCSYIIQLPDTDPANLDILYPLQVLKPLAAQLRSRTASDRIDDDLSWRERLARAVMGVPLEVTGRLAEPEVPLAALHRMAPGATMPVDLAPALRLLVEDIPLFEADLGDVDGRLALSLRGPCQQTNRKGPTP